jgi:hypothetical protein
MRPLIDGHQFGLAVRATGDDELHPLLDDPRGGRAKARFVYRPVLVEGCHHWNAWSVHMLTLRTPVLNVPVP